jgi:outer membrane protein OmpA-like peptidoglycan-associated protein
MAVVRTPLVLIPALAAATALTGCMTPRVHPTPSKAVIAARAHKDVEIAQANACPDASVRPRVGFGFDDATLKDVAMEPLDEAAEALTCHPELQAVIVGGADQHGTEAERRKLAQDRVQTVIDYLHAKGVAPERLKSEVALDGKPPAGDAQHMVVMAEGRRW